LFIQIKYDDDDDVPIIITQIYLARQLFTRFGPLKLTMMMMHEQLNISYKLIKATDQYDYRQPAHQTALKRAYFL